MFWVGVTGSMGSGKSTVAGLLRQRGYPVLDADEMARLALGPGTPGEAAVFRTFGQAVRGPQGHLDRRALGRVAFANPEKLDQLEKLIHPIVRQEITRARQQLAAQGHFVAFYDVPLLFEKNMETQFDHVLVVSADPQVRRQRLKDRSGLSDTEITERWSRQMPPERKEAKASAVIRNNGDLASLERSLDEALLALAIPLPPAAHA